MIKQKQPSKTVVKKKILSFLDQTAATPDYEQGQHCCGMVHRTALVLATSYKDMPRATALEFFHVGMDIYILGVPGGKIANIKRNPNVSAFIYQQPMNHAVFQRSLQIFGTAELITLRNRPRLFNSWLRKWNMVAVMTKLLQPIAEGKGLSGKSSEEFINKFISSCSFIKLSSEHIIYKEYPPDFSMHKFEWRK